MQRAMLVCQPKSCFLGKENSRVPKGSWAAPGEGLLFALL